MSPVARRISLAAAALLLLSLGLAGLALGPRGAVSAAAVDEPPADEPRLLGAEQAATFEFFNQGRDPAAGSGRGLFETDFFKPPPAPPPKPKPAAPTTREIPVFYRGLAAFPDGTDVAYLTVEGRMSTLARKDAVVDGWTLAEFDSERAVLAKGEERLTLPFNQRVALTVPVKP